jgi:hypothetical protein
MRRWEYLAEEVHDLQVQSLVAVFGLIVHAGAERACPQGDHPAELAVGRS